MLQAVALYAASSEGFMNLSVAECREGRHFCSFDVDMILQTQGSHPIMPAR